MDKPDEGGGVIMNNEQKETALGLFGKWPPTWYDWMPTSMKKTDEPGQVLTLGELFALQRRRANLTQGTLAAVAHVARNTIGSIEHDRYANIGIWTLQRVAQAMDCALLVSIVSHADSNEVELQQQRITWKEQHG
jgi:DNA-binding XRE family transcriptional regulator